MRTLLLSLSFAAAALAERPFFFIQMSDPQFGMYTDNRGFEHETANFEFAIATANRLKPAFVVVTGDLVNRPGDAAEIAEYKRIAAKLDPAVRLYSVPGNHDVGNEPTPASLAAWRKRFGPDYYTFRQGGVAGFVLDSMLEKAPQNLGEEAAAQESWLKAELAKAQAGGVTHLIVFQHHPFFLQDPSEKEEYFNIPVETRKRYLAIFHQYGVKWIFTGHHHRNGEARDGDLRIIITGPVGKPLDSARSGMRVVIVNDAAIDQRYYDFGDLPDAVN